MSIKQEKPAPASPVPAETPEPDMLALQHAIWAAIRTEKAVQYKDREHE